MKNRWILICGIAIVILVAALIWHSRMRTNRKSAMLPKIRGGQIHGVLYTTVDGEDISIPGLTVTVGNLESDGHLAEVSTDQRGRYTIPKQKPGRYKLSWRGVGWLSECDPRIVTVGNGTSYLSSSLVKADLSSGNERTVYGYVTLKDGTPCSIEDAYLSLHLQTSVVARETSSHFTMAVLANDEGQYILPAVPKAALSLEATCAGSTARTVIEPGVAQTTSVPLHFDNTAPQITRLDVNSPSGPKGTNAGARWSRDGQHGL